MGFTNIVAYTGTIIISYEGIIIIKLKQINKTKQNKGYQRILQ